MKKIEEIMHGKCGVLLESNVFVANTDNAPSIRDKLECLMNALKEASTKNDMSNEWMKYEPKFKQHFDAWKQCDNIDGDVKKFL